MNNTILYQKIYTDDYKELTKIMTSAFNEDTSGNLLVKMHKFKCFEFGG